MIISSDTSIPMPSSIFVYERLLGAWGFPSPGIDFSASSSLSSGAIVGVGGRGVNPMLWLVAWTGAHFSFSDGGDHDDDEVCFSETTGPSLCLWSPSPYVCFWDFCECDLPNCVAMLLLTPRDAFVILRHLALVTSPRVATIRNSNPHSLIKLEVPNSDEDDGEDKILCVMLSGWGGAPWPSLYMTGIVAAASAARSKRCRRP